MYWKFSESFKTQPTFNPSSTQWPSMTILHKSHFFRKPCNVDKT